MGAPAGALSWDALKLGLIVTGVVLPVRIATIWLQRRFIMGESAMGGLRVATAHRRRKLLANPSRRVLRPRN